MTQISTRRNCPIPDDCNLQNRCLLKAYPCNNRRHRANSIFSTHGRLDSTVVDARVISQEWWLMTPIDMTMFGVNGEFDSSAYFVLGLTFTADTVTDKQNCTCRFYTAKDGIDALYYAQATGDTPYKAVANVCKRINEGDYRIDNFAQQRARESRLRGR